MILTFFVKLEAKNFFFECSCKVKIVAKVMAQRMKSIFPKLVHNGQSGSIPRRNISENLHSILGITD